ncbi:right-handed parallel beta-helix repeat-containing protein [Chiayiivirga flava]|uniref:Right handed beta helix domain-containing protein n=1 Tax=Chiayiivirga flava TaxID=659595 RepID=A0A7W8D6L0_9GAMM|nr:right-handed parallel beta-helix repeat-containing protein [Chiayiivirga flava]MBB5207647.1 hypothetical protein [Chiayiivirga flava]
MTCNPHRVSRVHAPHRTALAACLCLVLQATAAATGKGAGTFLVTSAADAGPGSLRQAILDANGAGGGTVAFAIDDDCLIVIAPLTPLPTVTVPLVIDGLTQSGSSPNTSTLAYDAQHCIVLNSNISHALRLEPPAGTTITVRGLGFDNFNTAAIEVEGAGAAHIEGNGFGGGFTALFNGFATSAIRVVDAPGTVIGGDTPAQRNVVGNALGAGIFLGLGGPRTVRNNLVGIGVSGFSNIGNNVGIDLVDAYGTLIEGNSIGHNDSFGVRVAMPTFSRASAAKGGPEFYNRIVGNLIGYSPVPNGSSRDAGNTTNGIRLTSGANIQVLDNTIAFSTNDGLNAQAAVQAARISGNRFLRNGDQAIDLNPNGVDPQDEDTVPGPGANGTQNYPELDSAVGDALAGTVRGSLTTRSGDYTVEFYSNAACDSTGHGEAENFVGAIDVNVPFAPIPPGDKTVDFVAPVQAGDGESLAGGVIVALAHDASGNTSELSACVAYTDTSLFADGFE